MERTARRLAIARPVLFLIQLSVLLHGSLAQDSPRIGSNCSAPKVFMGDAAFVTCYFDTDLNTKNNNFAVYHYQLDTGAQTRVLDCYWRQKDKPECNLPVSGYTFNRIVTDQLTVDIPRASLSFQGKYECKAEPSYPKFIHPCTLVLEEKPMPPTTAPPPGSSSGHDGTTSSTVKDDEGESGDNTAAIVVVVVLLIVLLVAGIILFKCRSRVREHIPCLRSETDKSRTRDVDERGSTSGNQHELVLPLLSTPENEGQTPTTSAPEDVVRMESERIKSEETTDDKREHTERVTTGEEGGNVQDFNVEPRGQSTLPMKMEEEGTHNKEPSTVQDKDGEEKKTPGVLGEKRTEQTPNKTEENVKQDANKDGAKTVDELGDSNKLKDPGVLQVASPTKNKEGSDSNRTNAGAEASTFADAPAGRTDTEQMSQSSSLEPDSKSNGRADNKGSVEPKAELGGVIGKPRAAVGERSHPSDKEKTDDQRPNQNLLFYQNKIRSRPAGAFIDEIHQEWGNNYDLIEKHHTYIQWLFPTREDPEKNRHAQRLRSYEIKAIVEDKTTLRRFIKSYEMMLNFFGFKLVNHKTGEIACRDNAVERFRHLLDPRHKHNFLRITRILTCLGEMGLERYKAPLVQHLIYQAMATGGNLEEIKNSCKLYWIPIVADDKKKEELWKLAEEAFGD